MNVGSFLGKDRGFLMFGHNGGIPICTGLGFKG